MRYFIQYNGDSIAIGWIETNEIEFLDDSYVEVTKEDYLKSLSENNILYVPIKQEKTKLPKTELELLQERITQLEVLQVNSMSLQIETKILGGNI